MVWHGALRIIGFVCLALLSFFLVYGAHAEPEATTHKAYIVCQEKESVVVPGSLFVKQGDNVEFSAVSAEVVVFFPQIGTFSRNISEQVFEVEAGKSKRLSVLSDAPLGVYHYAVYCGGEARDFAKGYSSPIMIIGPP